MPRKIFISFLGTGKYEACNYAFGDQVYHTRFVQEALVKHLCAEWTKNDLLLFGLTAEAQSKHWQPETGESGLKNIIHEISSHTVVDTLSVPSVENENDIWYLFTLLFDRFKENDEVYLDITHSWRFQPMLFMALLQYLKTLKNAVVKGIYYGAYEPNRPLTEFTPIMDLTPFSVMQDWAQAASVFVKYGLADQALDLNQEVIDPEKVNSGLKSRLEHFQQSLQFWSLNTQSIRGEILMNERTVSFMRMNAKQLGSSVIPPIKLLADYILDDLKTFPQHSGIEQLESLLLWYRQKNRIVEGFTLLSELLVERILLLNKTALHQLIEDFRVKNRDSVELYKLNNERHLIYKVVKSCFSRCKTEAFGKRFYLKEDVRGLSGEMVDHIMTTQHNIREVSHLSIRVDKFRDDINHAGLIDNPLNPFEFKRNFEILVDEYFHLKWH